MGKEGSTLPAPRLYYQPEGAEGRVSYTLGPAVLRPVPPQAVKPVDESSWQRQSALQLAIAAAAVCANSGMEASQQALPGPSSRSTKAALACSHDGWMPSLTCTAPTWMFWKQEPSLTSRKAKAPAPASRPVFTQPPMRMVLPTCQAGPTKQQVAQQAWLQLCSIQASAG